MTERVQHLIDFFADKDQWVPQCGIYNCRNTVGDEMTTIYSEPAEGVVVDACYPYDYIEVFGLSMDEFRDFRREMAPIIDAKDPFNSLDDDDTAD